MFQERSTEEITKILEEPTNMIKPDYTIEYANISELIEIAKEILSHEYEPMEFSIENLILMKEMIQSLNKLINKIKNYYSNSPSLIIKDNNHMKIIEIKD